MISFVESGMNFGEFDDANVFRIEKSHLLQRCQGVQTVEFIWKKKKTKLVFVEAKSSSPIVSGQKREHYETFITEIVGKFLDSFNLLVSCLLKRRTGWEEIPDGIRTEVDYSKIQFQFVLIINGHEEKWLPGLQKELQESMKKHHKIWNSTVVVMNDKIAREQHFIM